MPNVLSIEPTPVHLTALPKIYLLELLKISVKIKINTPSPTLLIKSDFIYSLTMVEVLGTKIIVTTNDKIHFINEIRLKEKPFTKH